MLQRIQDAILFWDYRAWYFINTICSNPVCDAVASLLRNQWTWAPLYLFLLIFMPANFKRKGWIWCACFLITFALSDQVSAHWLKPLFHRPRPCNDPMLRDIINVLVPCGGGYSFPSSHAANHFSMAFFGCFTLRKLARWVWWAAISWAGLVSISQVYVGVHYPTDVLVGALIGAAIGTATGGVFNRYVGLERAAGSA